MLQIAKTTCPYCKSNTDTGHYITCPAFFPNPITPAPISFTPFNFEEFQDQVVWTATKPGYYAYIDDLEAPAKPTCECGAASIGVGAHSSWCPLFKEET